eukprot:3234431-Rhodomonas_salina.2
MSTRIDISFNGRVGIDFNVGVNVNGRAQVWARCIPLHALHSFGSPSLSSLSAALPRPPRVTPAPCTAQRRKPHWRSAKSAQRRHKWSAAPP